MFLIKPMQWALTECCANKNLYYALIVKRVFSKATIWTFETFFDVLRLDANSDTDLGIHYTASITVCL